MIKTLMLSIGFVCSALHYNVQLPPDFVIFPSEGPCLSLGFSISLTPFVPVELLKRVLIARMIGNLRPKLFCFLLIHITVPSAKRLSSLFFCLNDRVE